MSLIVDDVDELNPQDISYVYSGYAPLSVRLVQLCVTGSASNMTALKLKPDYQPTWKGAEDALKHVPGPNVEVVQEPNQALSRASSQPEKVSKIAVCFLGGCTFTEIAALRLLGKRTGIQFLVLTTSVVSGQGIIESLLL